MKTLIDKLLADAISSDPDIWDQSRLALWFLMEYNRKDVYNEDLKQFYRNYLSDDFIGVRIGPELEQYLVIKVVEIIQNVDHYTDPGLFMVISWAENVSAVGALLHLIQNFPSPCDSGVALQAITCLLNNMLVDDQGQPGPEIVTHLILKNPKPFLERIIKDDQDKDMVTKARYALKAVDSYLDKAGRK